MGIMKEICLRMFYTYFQNDHKIMKKITDYSKLHLKIIWQIWWQFIVWIIIYINSNIYYKRNDKNLNFLIHVYNIFKIIYM